MKNVAKRSQKSRERVPSRNAPSAAPIGFAVDACATDGDAAKRSRADVLGIFAHEQRDDDDRQRRRAADDGDGRAPSAMLDHRREHRQKDELARRRARRENAEGEPAPLDEPAVHDGGAEYDRDHARREPNADAPDDDELPRRRDSRRETDACGERSHRDHGRSTHAESLHQRAGERSHETVEQDVDRHGERDRRARPMEFLLERNDQHARRGAHAGRCEKCDEGRREDDPRVVNGASTGHARKHRDGDKMCAARMESIYFGHPERSEGSAFPDLASVRGDSSIVLL